MRKSRPPCSLKAFPNLSALLRYSNRLLLLILAFGVSPSPAEVVTPPYIQNLTSNEVDLYWVETEATPRRVNWQGRRTRSSAKPAPELGFHPQEISEFPELSESPPRYLHHARLNRLPQSRTEIKYSVNFEEETFRGQFRPLPKPDSSVKLIAFADPETEPESTGTPVKWAAPGVTDRLYLVDQTQGLQANLTAISESRPDALLIAGDLVESGGEQRDWDEFWRQFGPLASSVSLLAAPGNHDYYAGPRHGRYTDAGSRWAIEKFRTYFRPTGPITPPHYYRKDIGLATVLSLDLVDGLPHLSESDSNHYLEAAGKFAPAFHKGSPQWTWLEAELQDCQRSGRFTIVLFHHCPYSSGVHGHPAGTGPEKDPLSGVPARGLSELFLKYGVELALCGHDEMLERSVLEGWEELPSGRKRRHSLQVYDIGIAGDGLRGPVRSNEYSKFLAYRDAPEIWEGEALKSGGVHYGHLEIDIVAHGKGWKATLTPIYILPQKIGEKWTFQRLTYPDTVVMTLHDETSAR